MRTKILLSTMFNVTVLLMTVTGCSKEEPNKQNHRIAILGVEGVRLSKDATLKGDAVKIPAGTELSVIEEHGLGLLVCGPDGVTNWCRRAYVCTKEEWETRVTQNQVPNMVTFMGPADGGGYKMYGNVQIRNNSVALIPGQAIWLDENLCKARPEIEWEGKMFKTRTDALYLVLENGLVELPAWPNGRVPEKSKMVK